MGDPTIRTVSVTLILHKNVLNSLPSLSLEAYYGGGSKNNPPAPHGKNHLPPMFGQRNYVFVANSDFLTPISLQPNVVDLRYFKL